MEVWPVTIRYFDFGRVPTALKQDWSRVMGQVVDSGVLIGGPVVRSFEEDWAQFVGAADCVSVGNGLDALTLALRTLGVQANDLVAVPAHTFFATWLAVAQVGATPVAVDCLPGGQLDVEALAKSGIAFRAVIPVHMHGTAVEMPALMEWAERTQTLVIEDCAQAHGLRIAGRHVGTWGHIGAFSFYPTKNLGCLGDGGCVVTNDLNLARDIRSLRNYGSVDGNKYRHEQLGINSRLDPIQAAVLAVNLKYLDEWLIARQEIAREYLMLMRQTDPAIRPLTENAADSVWHHFVALTRNRDTFRHQLKDLSVETEIHYPICAAEEFARLSDGESTIADGDYANARTISEFGLSLPLNQWMTQSDVDAVCRAVEVACDSGARLE